MYIALSGLCCTDTYEIVREEAGTYKMAIPYHYETNVRSTGGASGAARARRLAQEAVTLSTSLPLSYSSSVFVRCDEERLDVMKVRKTAAPYHQIRTILTHFFSLSKHV